MTGRKTLESDPALMDHKTVQYRILGKVSLDGVSPLTFLFCFSMCLVYVFVDPRSSHELRTSPERPDTIFSD